MTLIFAKDAPEFAAIADIALSVPQGDDETEALLPLHPQPVKYATSDGSRLSGATQKMTIFGNTLTLWSGNHAVAKVLVNAIFEQSMGGTVAVDIGEVLATCDLTDEQKADVGLMCFFMSGDQILTQYIACVVGDHKGTRIITQGSGIWDFLVDTTGGIDFVELLSRAVLALATEALSGRTYDYLYGGWFELGILDENLAFKKVPYALKFWQTKGDVISLSGPTIYSAYEDNSLVLTSIFPKGTATDTNVNEITDFLHPRAGFIDKIPAWKPDYLFHIVYPSPGEEPVVRVFMETDDQSITWIIGDHGPKKFEVKKGFLDMLAQKSTGDYSKIHLFKDFN